MKPKNPKREILSGVAERKPTVSYALFSQACDDGYKLGYAAGLRDGERKMARQVRRWIMKLEGSTPKESRIAFFDWLTIVCGLTARQKRGKR